MFSLPYPLNWHCRDFQHCFVGVCVFLVPVLGASVKNVTSASLGCLLLLSLVYVKKWQSVWLGLTSAERVLLSSYILFIIAAFLGYINAEDGRGFSKEYARHFRFVLIVPICLLLVSLKVRAYKYLLLGLITSGPAFLIATLWSLYVEPGMPAKGQYYQIIFGDIAMMNAVILVAYVFMDRFSAGFKILFLCSALCGVYASIMSHARSAWLIVPVCLVIFLLIGILKKKIKVWPVMTFILLLIASLPVVNNHDIGNVIKSRIDLAASQMREFESGERYNHSIGIRLALWDVAFDVWKENPIIGTGLGDFDEEFEKRKSGKYDLVKTHSNAHNIYIQSLTSTGIIGFFALLMALVILPAKFFYDQRGEGIGVEAVTGLILVVSFAVFGLTESWTLRAPFLSLFVVYISVLISSSILSRRQSADYYGSGEKTVRNA